MAAMNVPHLVRQLCPFLRTARGRLVKCSPPVCSSFLPSQKSCCVSGRLLLVNQGDDMIEPRSLLPSLMRSCIHTVRCSTTERSSHATAVKRRVFLDSQDGDWHTFVVPCVSTSSTRIPELQNGDMDMHATALGGVGLLASALQFPEASLAETMEFSFGNVMTFFGGEPSNALSLPTWVIHIASVAEWVTAMVLVWKYGDTEGRSAWKGLTWGMVPLLGGAMCACTWHFFYNAESLEALVVLQAFLTVTGNFTMWAAAYRIWKSSQENATVD